MAVLTPTSTSSRTPVGRYQEFTYRVTTGAAAADEWIATPFRDIVAVSYAVLGTGSTDANFVLGAQGTGQTEGSSPRDLGVETAGAADLLVTVRGLP